MIDPLLQSHTDLLARARVALQNTPSAQAESGKALLTEIAVAERCLATGALPWPITVHVGIVEHRHGKNIYTACNAPTLTREIAEFCREYWSELHGAGDETLLDDEAVVSAYFDLHPQDALMRETSTLETPAGVGASKTFPYLERGRYCVLSTAHVTVTTADLISLWATWPPSARPIDIAASVHGWFVPTRPLEEPHAGQLPQDLRALMTFGRDGGFDYVLLDCDGDEADGLKIHTW